MDFIEFTKQDIEELKSSDDKQALVGGTGLNNAFDFLMEHLYGNGNCGCTVPGRNL